MALYRYTLKNDVLAETEGWLAKGCSVEVPIQNGRPIFPDMVKEAFIRKYGKCPSTTSIQCACKEEKLS